MAQSTNRKSIAVRFRRLALESLQTRFVFTGALHAFLDMGQLGYGETVADVGIGATGEIRILGDGFTAGGKVWDFDGAGNLIKQETVGALAGPGRIATPQRISPNGGWLAGAQRDSNFSYDAFSRWPGNELSSFVPVEGAAGVLDAANTGDLLVAGKDNTAYRWNSTQGLISLKPLEGAVETYATAISGDGSVIIGRSYVGNKMVPTLWDASGPRALPSIEKNMAANSVSEDGRVIGGNTTWGNDTAVVWANGTVKQLVDESGAPAKGAVDVVVNGLWGDSDRWVAFGNYDNKPWIAFDDGVARPLEQWLLDHHDIALDDPPQEFGFLPNFRQYNVIAAKADGNNLKIVLVEREVTAQTHAIPPSILYGSTRPHLLVVPLDNSALPLEVHPIDVNNDGAVSPLDAWIIINQLNEGKAGLLAERPGLTLAWPNIDTSGDGVLSALDAIKVINLLNRNSEQSLAASEGEGESRGVVSDLSPSLVDIDSVFGELGARTKGYDGSGWQWCYMQASPRVF